MLLRIISYELVCYIRLRTCVANIGMKNLIRDTVLIYAFFKHMCPRGRWVRLL